MLSINYLPDDKYGMNLTLEFLNSRTRPKIIFGRTEHAKSVAMQVEVDGFVDDFTADREYLGKPVYKTEDVPKDDLVLSVVLGKPLTVKRKLEQARIENIDYFFFYKKHIGLPLKPITCWDEFAVDFNTNQTKYEWIYNLLADEESKKVFQAVVNFRLSGNIAYMERFSDRQDSQYFENFLNLSNKGEVFVDIGGFDGLTTLEFVKRSPNYQEVYFFEPEKDNMLVAKKNLGALQRVNYYNIALSDQRGILPFSSNGSTFQFDEKGDSQVQTECLDNIIRSPVSFIKMDIEGAEKSALAGAREIIQKYQPKLAICVYHKGDDFWKIPKQVLSYRQDYRVYMRHYTEGVDETVMFFVAR